MLFDYMYTDLGVLIGPIVRVSPNEVMFLHLLISTETDARQLHFRNPEVYHKIYVAGSKFTKDPSFYAMFAQENAIFGIIPPAVHKVRKDLLNSLFSRRAVLGIEPLIQSKVELIAGSP